MNARSRPLPQKRQKFLLWHWMDYQATDARRTYVIAKAMRHIDETKVEDVLHHPKKERIYL